MSRTRYSSRKKLEIALEAIRGDHSINEISSANNIHPSMISKWKTDLEKNGTLVYESGSSKDKRKIKELEEKLEDAYKEIGKITAQREWLKKKSGLAGLDV